MSLFQFKQINTTQTNQIPVITGLLTTGVLNTKIGEVDNKIPDVSKLIKKADYDAKIKDTERKHFTTADYNKFTSSTRAAEIK